MIVVPCSGVLCRLACLVGLHRWWDPDWIYADGEECERCGALR